MTEVFVLSVEHACTQILSLSRTHTRVYTDSLSLSLSHTHTHACTHILSLSLPLTHTISQSLSLLHTHTFSLSLSLSHTHARMDVSHSDTHHIHARTQIPPGRAYIHARLQKCTPTHAKDTQTPTPHQNVVLPLNLPLPKTDHRHE